jgi:hypothetical protein
LLFSGKPQRVTRKDPQPAAELPQAVYRRGSTVL